MPSSSSRRRSHKKRCSLTMEARDWASLPRDILVDVFLKLGPCREIMRGAERACTAWRRVAVDEPLLWRRIDINAGSSSGLAMARAAVDRSRGQCEAFSGPVDEDSLIYLVESAPSLKSLHLSYGQVGSEILKMALEKLTLLEDLEISTAYSSANLFKSICQARPHLEKLRVTFPDDDNKFWGSCDSEFYDGGLREFSTMCELRSLELFEFELSTEGLKAILDNCPLLELLHVFGSFFDFEEMDEELELKCARVKNLILPFDGDEDDYGYYGEPWGWGQSSEDEFY
ncbi:hypothetical protein PR202_ga27484 [Eleusine coracana subsp. coracana]|uniref:F-box domain-containing protein n=1 Tax=Eleusine coracana subsp. coracana TaxID=191504 RepID=A0AAV5DHS8_ELECO|nr:hypothetical protein QOZ80_8AG0620410 [Eleusine coracana subsp. coracana]GJN09475.1 hypothetical protein PR202_ga27484 [Eleusine coracana subsp. coracana]